VGEINGNGSQISVTGLTARASAPSGTIAGIYNDTANARLAHVSATASGPAGNRYGMLNVTATSTITVDRSTFSGTTNSIFNGANSSVRIGWSKLTGPVTTPAGSSTTCVFSYNGSYAAVNGLCQ
jgi:hypothetical protein